MADPTVPPTGAANAQYWVQHLTFRMSQEGGNELRSAIKSIAGDVRDLEGGFNKLGGSVAGSLKTISNLAKAAFGAFGIYATANISNVVGELDKYNKALVALRPLTFQYGAGVDSLEKSVMSIGKTLKFTREQMLSLSQSYLKGFNYAPVAKMSGFLHMAAMATGENVEAMQSYIQVMQGLGKQSAVFERVQLPGDQGEVRTGAIQGLTLAQAAVGKIDPSTYAQVAGYMEAIRKESMGIDDADTRRNKQMREQMETLRNVQKIWDDIKISIAQQIMPLMTQFSRWLASHHDGLVKIASQVIAIGKYVAIAGGAVAAFRVAKNILPGMAKDRAIMANQFGPFMAPSGMSREGAKAYSALPGIKGKGAVSQVVSTALGATQSGHPVPVTIVGISPGVSWGGNWGGTIGAAGTAGPAGAASSAWQRSRTLGRGFSTADRIAAIRSARGDFRANTAFSRLGAQATRLGPEGVILNTLGYDVSKGSAQAMRSVGLGKVVSGAAAAAKITGKIAGPIGGIAGSVGRAGLGLGRGIAGAGRMVVGSLGAGITGGILGRELYDEYVPEGMKKGFGTVGGYAHKIATLGIGSNNDYGTFGGGLSSVAGGAAAGALIGGPIGAAGGAIVGGTLESGRVFMEGQSIAADAMKAVDENRRKFDDYKKGAIDKAKSLGDTSRITALEKQGQIREASDQADKMKSGFGYRFLGLGSDNIKKQEEEVQRLRRAYQGWVDDQALSVTATQEQQDTAKNLRVQIEALIASTKKLESEGKTGPELAAAKARLATRRDEYADIMATGTKKDDQGRTVSALGAGGATDKANKVLEDQKQKMRDQVEAADKLLRVSTAYLQYQKQIEEVMESQLRLLESQGTLFQQRQRFAGLAAISDPIGGLTEIKSNFETYMKQVDESEAATKRMIGTFDSLSELVKKEFQLPKLDIEQKRISLIPNEEERNKANAEFEKIKSDRQKLINEINAMNITGPTGQKVTGEQVVEDPEGKARLVAENAIRERRNKLESELNNLAAKRLDASRDYSKSLEPAIENQRLQVQQLSTINSLYENFGMGLSASISQRMQLIEAIGKENTLLQQQAGLNNERIDQFGKELQIALQTRSEIQRQADLSTGDDQLKFKAALIEADKKIDTIRGSQNQLLMDQRKIQNDILTNVTKQAEQAKVMREGYISAINAMNTGTGVFKKIVIDQNSQLGVLMRQFSGQVPMGIRTGQASPRFAGIGLQESSGFNVGGWYGPSQSLEEHQSKLLNFPIPNVVNGLSPAQAQKAIYDITTRSQGASQESRAVMANRGGVSRLMDRTFPAQSFSNVLEIIKKNEEVIKTLPNEMQTQVKSMLRGEQAEISPAQATASVQTVIETLRALPANNPAKANLSSLEKTYQDEMYTTNWYNQRSETMKTEIAEAMKAKSEAVQNVKVVNTDPIKVQAIQSVAAKPNTAPAAPQAPQGFEVSTPEGPGMQMPDGSIVVDTDNILQRNKGGTISFSDDGKIPGRGPNRDTVPAMLTKGEFVVNRDAVDHYGDGFLYALNNRSVPKNMLNVGGFVGYQEGGEIAYNQQRAQETKVLRDQYELEINRGDYSHMKEYRDSFVQKSDSELNVQQTKQEVASFERDKEIIKEPIKDVQTYRDIMSKKEQEMAEGKLSVVDSIILQSAKNYYIEKQRSEEAVQRIEQSNAEAKTRHEKERDESLKRLASPPTPTAAKEAYYGSQDMKTAVRGNIKIAPSPDLVGPVNISPTDFVYPKEASEKITSITSEITQRQTRETELIKQLNRASPSQRKAIAAERISNRAAIQSLRKNREAAKKSQPITYSTFLERYSPTIAVPPPPAIEPPSIDMSSEVPEGYHAEVNGAGDVIVYPDTDINVMTEDKEQEKSPSPMLDMTLKKKEREIAYSLSNYKNIETEAASSSGTLKAVGSIAKWPLMPLYSIATTTGLVDKNSTAATVMALGVNKIGSNILKTSEGALDRTRSEIATMQQEQTSLLNMPKDDESIRAIYFIDDVRKYINDQKNLIASGPKDDISQAQMEKYNEVYRQTQELEGGIAAGLSKSELSDKLMGLRKSAENQIGSLAAAEKNLDSDAHSFSLKIWRQERVPLWVNKPMKGIVEKKNSGGTIGVDTEPAMLSPGEFVVRKNAVDNYGLKFMKHINEGKPIKKYAQGGFVATGVVPNPMDRSSNPLTGSGSSDMMSISTGKSNVNVEIELSQSQMRDMKDALVNDMTSLIDKAMKATESRLMSSLTGGA